LRWALWQWLRLPQRSERFEEGLGRSQGDNVLLAVGDWFRDRQAPPVISALLVTFNSDARSAQTTPDQRARGSAAQLAVAVRYLTLATDYGDVAIRDEQRGVVSPTDLAAP
jgi:hypothetical protein